MQIARTLPQLRRACAELVAERKTLSLVPTMGALHAGHVALIDAARAGGGAIAASIFVNPTQFAANEDLGRYPRPEADDLAALKASGCDLAWLPDVATMYPSDDATVIDVAGPALSWEGTQRPGHFRGVATVVAKLIGQTRADRAYFGEKDWQQLQVVRRMTADLHLRTEIVAVPTVREPDGLAMSSRNRFLTAEQRRAAPLLFAVLRDTARGLRLDRRGGACHAGRMRLEQAGFVVDYFELVDPQSLLACARPDGAARLIAAARLGDVRLLDNVGLS